MIILENKKLNDKQIYELINKELTILEENYRYNYGKKIPYEEQFDLFNDLYTLFNSFSDKDNVLNVASKLCVKRYIPLLDLIVKIDTKQDRLLEYEKHLKNAYKMASRTSLEHYMVYREWDTPYKDKFFEPRYEIMEAYIHYLQELECNPDFEKLVFNCPSGYGKTFPAKISEAWGFGIDDTGTFLSLCSNDSVVKAGSNLVKEEMMSEHFGEVFPKLKYDKEDKSYFLKDTEGEWKLKNCKLALSYITSTTNSNVVGTRASKRIHIDDLYPDFNEAMNTKTNDLYINKEKTVWRKRFVQNKKVKELITGTLWASGDFIAQTIDDLKKEYNFIPHPKYKYVLINIDKPEDLGKETIAIIQIPALDYVTDETTCPELKTTRELRKERETMPEYLWETNFQQKPTDPEALIFSYDKIKTYSKLKPTDYFGTYAVIDATRKSGKDNFSMPIFQKYDNGNAFEYQLIDCIFTKTATSALYEDIIEKIQEHHIIKLVIESNTASELKSNLDKMLNKKGITYCETIDKYNTENKLVRIIDKSFQIQTILIFPEKGIHGINSPIGKFMLNLTTFNSKGRNENDDSPDSCSLFISEIVEEKSKPQKAVPTKRIC